MSLPDPVVSSGSMSGLSNAALVDRFRQSDQHAFAELFRRHRQLVYSVCWRWLGHHQDAEDVTQETFRRLASSIDRYDACRPMEPWLVRIAGNCCRTILMRRRRELTSVDWSKSDDLVPLNASSPSDSLMDIELDQAISQLPMDTRLAFELVHCQGWSYEQVSRHTGHPIGTIKVWVHRARLRLIETFQPRMTDSSLSDGAL